MRIIKLSAVVGLALSLGLVGGCSYFKSGKGAAGSEGAQTSGLSESDEFSNDGISAENRLKAPYNQSYHFDYDQYEVKSEDLESIKIQANYLVAHSSAKVRLEGNADERGSREYNVALGWKRTKAVAAVLKQQGITDAQIVMISYGKEKPVALGHDESAYSQNRRTDLFYESK